MKELRWETELGTGVPAAGVGTGAAKGEAGKG